MPEPKPINTKTIVKRIPIAQTPDLGGSIETLCDNMGSAGYLLSSSFEIQNQLVLVFQIPR